MAVEITETPRHTLTVSEQNWQLKLSTSVGDTLPDDATFDNVTVSQLLTANHIHGNLAGSVYVHVFVREDVSKGDPVYITGFNVGNSEPEVHKAQANDNAKMPAVGVMANDYTANTHGADMVISGVIEDVNTNGFGVNTPIYVGPTGGFTSTKPSINPQQVGICDRDNQNNGSFVVTAKAVSPNQDLDTTSSVNFSNITIASDLSAGANALQVGSNSVLTSSDSLSITGAGRFLPQASAPTSPVAGQVYFDSTLNKLRCYDGTSWNNLF